MTRINVQRDGQDAFAPFTGPAELVQTSPGAWSTGSEIPLASFEPGYYTFMITVRDLNAAKGTAANKGVERKRGLHRPHGRRVDAAQGGRQARRAGQAEEAVSGRYRKQGRRGQGPSPFRLSSYSTRTLARAVPIFPLALSRTLTTIR